MSVIATVLLMGFALFAVRALAPKGEDDMRRGPGEILALILGIAVLVILVLMPFWWVMSSSIKDPDEIISRTPTLLIPHSFTLEHYRHLLARRIFPAFLANSLIVSFFSMAVTVLLAVLAGYAFFRLKFPGAACALPRDPDRPTPFRGLCYWCRFTG